MLDERSDQIFAMTDVLAERVREAHGMIDEHNDVATASLLEVFIDKTEWRAWFLYETSHAAPRRTGHSPPRACRAADGPIGPLGV
jgi:DNA-binding ferritin-like protein